MPPASARRRARKEPELQKSEPDHHDAIQTPTRKRRRVNGADSAVNAPASAPTSISAAKPRQSVDTEETIDNQVMDHDIEADSYHLADEVIRHLRVASYGAAVTHKYNNNIVDRAAKAFAKIAGRDWTFYVSKIKVTIGRPNTKKAPPPNSESSYWQAQLQDVDIDLGPDQQVSRFHAEIGYDGEQSRWFIFVNGRNGGYVDDTRLEPGTRTWLSSGNVINILGTQMMFLLPESAPEIHHSIQKQLLAEDETEPEIDPRDTLNPPTSASRRGRGTSNAQQTVQATNSTNRTQNSSIQQAPGTPISKNKGPSQPKSKTSPSYQRGVMMESTEEIDYSLDSARDIKPPHSYAAMIGQAILSTPEEKATLAKIYEYIKEKYAYFRHTGQGWQNSIRHNLSLSKSFEKVPRRTDEPGKGMKWQIVAEHREEFMKKNMQPARRARNLGSSAPNSPANNMGAVAQTERLITLIGEPSSTQKRNRSATPPLSSYPVATESYTPDRGPQASFLTSGPLPAAHSNTPPTGPDAITPTYDRSRGVPLGVAGEVSTRPDGLRAAVFNSPPTLMTTSYDGQPGGHLFTPLPERSKPMAAIQSTCKAPSFYAKDLFSSPAPFWKFAEIGSTPARLPELSPLKMSKEEGDETSPVKPPVDEEDEEEDKSDQAIREDMGEETEIQPSSPPLETEQQDMSPTRTVSRPASRHIASTVPPIAPKFEVPNSVTASNHLSTRPQTTEATTQESRLITPPKTSDTPAQDSVSPVSSYPKPLPTLMPMAGPGALAPRVNNGYSSRMEIDDEDDGDIDLTRGFEKIGSFHQTIQANGISR